MRLLLAEDEKPLSRAVTAILQRSHYTVDAVYDGEEAMEYLESDIYDAIILDIMMPKKNGLEVLKYLRQKGDLTPVLMLTAKGEVCLLYTSTGALALSCARNVVIVGDTRQLPNVLDVYKRQPYFCKMNSYTSNSFGSAPNVTLHAVIFPSDIRSNTPTQNGSSKNTVSLPVSLSMTIPP